jgi:GTPase SAR1 family protein
MSETTRISLWGAPRTGKTTYVAALYHQLETVHNMRWNPSMYDAEGNMTQSEDFKRIVRKLDDGELPEATEATPRQYKLRGQQDLILGRKNTVEMNVIDASGGLVGEDFGVNPARREAYWDEVRASDALFMLIDPDKSQADFSYYSLFDELFSAITPPNEAYTDKVVAVCITKIDLERHWIHRKSPQAYLRSFLHERALTRLLHGTNPRKTAFFAVSSIGRYPHNDDAGYPNLRQVVVNEGGINARYDLVTRIAKPDQWQPYEVVAPFRWVLHRFGQTV